MKKMFIVLGIAFALIVGAIVSCSVVNANAEVTEPITIEEAVDNYLAEEYVDSEIDNVKVVETGEDKNYGGHYVAATFDVDGESCYTKIAMSVL